MLSYQRTSEEISRSLLVLQDNRKRNAVLSINLTVPLGEMTGADAQSLCSGLGQQQQARQGY